MKKTFLIISTFLAFLTFYFFYESYLKWDFNSEGKAFDQITGVAYDENASVWGILTLIFILPITFVFFSYLKKKFK